MPAGQPDDLTVTHHPDQFENLVNLFAQSVKCTAGSRGIVYITVPITSGYNQFLLMDELGCTPDELRTTHAERYKRDVFDANMRTSESWSAQARSAFPGRVVLDPSPLFVKGFEQPHYYDLWNKVIRLYADTVIATPKWAFSMGSRKEVEMAIASGLRVVDMSGADFDVEDLIRQDAEARTELASWGWSSKRIAESIPPLDVARNTEPRPPIAVVNTHWEDVIRRVNDDLLNFIVQREPPVYSAELDDERTRSSNPLDVWRSERLQSYWDRMVSAGLETDRGRLELSSLAGTSVAMLRSAVRLHGRLTTHRDMERTGWKNRPQPATSGPDYTDLFALNEIDAEVWTWIRDEHRAMRSEFSENFDDEMLGRLSVGSSGGGWTGQLWNEYFDVARHSGLDTRWGRYHLGRFTTGVLRMLESSVREHGPIPRRQVRDITRDALP